VVVRNCVWEPFWLRFESVRGLKKYQIHNFFNIL